MPARLARGWSAQKMPAIEAEVRVVEEKGKLIHDGAVCKRSSLALGNCSKSARTEPTQPERTA